MKLIKIAQRVQEIWSRYGIQGQIPVSECQHITTKFRNVRVNGMYELIAAVLCYGVNAV